MTNTTICDYLIARLQDYGLADVFGLPGDYVLSFYTKLFQSPINVVTCTREDCAGYAADAYARMTGFGAVCITYCVGGLSCTNSIAGAYAEKSPVLVISGSPGLSERQRDVLLHHTVGAYTTQHEIYRNICVATADLNDPTIAFREIDRVLEAVTRYKRPGYLELPRDLVDAIPPNPHVPAKTVVESDPGALREAVSETARRIGQAIRPVIIAGVEMHRFNLQDSLLKLVEGTGIPFATTAQGKSVISEQHPLFAGIYDGGMSRDTVKEFVEESDCVLLLGGHMHDINSGIFTHEIDPLKVIHATSEKLRISHHSFEEVLLGDFIEQLAEAELKCPTRAIPKKPDHDQPFQLKPDEPIRISRLIERLNHSLTGNSVVVADIGDSLFASLDLSVSEQTKFMSMVFYTSMGFSVPASLGVKIAEPESRPFVIAGDGAFQMTMNELSTIVRHKLNPIVILFDNRGYGTERFLHEGEWEFNDIHPWNYSKLPDVLGGGCGYEIKTEGEFDAALNTAVADESQFHLLHVHIGLDDTSVALRRLAERLILRVQK